MKLSKEKGRSKRGGNMRLIGFQSLAGGVLYQEKESSWGYEIGGKK